MGELQMLFDALQRILSVQEENIILAEEILFELFSKLVQARDVRHRNAPYWMVSGDKSRFLSPTHRCQG